MATYRKIFFAAFSLATIFCLAKSGLAQIVPASGYLYPIKVYSKFGYINAEGKTVVEPKYNLARDFFEGYGLVLMGDSAIGLINSSGTVVYMCAKPYPGKWSGYMLLASENSMMIGYQINFSDTGAKAGFIDPERNQITPATFFSVSGFHNGLAMASNVGNFYCDADSALGLGCGNLVAHPVFGYINRSGKYKIAPAYRVASSFYHGYAVVKKRDDTLAEIIDTTGAKVKLTDILDDSFKCFYYVFTNEDIDAYNEEYPTDRTFNEDFLNGFIQYANSHKDKDGKLKLPPEHRYAYKFSEGIATTDSVNDSLMAQHTFVTLYDTLLSPEAHKYCHPFHEGVAGVQKNGKWGFISKEGKYIIEPIFDYLWQGYIFKGGVSKVLYEDKISYINKKGEIIWAESARSWDW